MSWHPDVPFGATHAQLSLRRGSIKIVVELNAIDDFRTIPGQITFGRLRYAEDFIPVPEDSQGFRNEPFRELLAKVERPKVTAFEFTAAPLPVLASPKPKTPPPAPVVKVKSSEPSKTKASAEVRNGIVRPSIDSQAGIAWERFQDFESSAKRPVTRTDYLTIATEEGIKPSSIAVYFSNWKKFNA